MAEREVAVVVPLPLLQAAQVEKEVVEREQVLPQLADITVYRWEYNFRASTVMGMVGAGGIGFELMGSLRIMQYQEVSAILLVILLMVTLVDTFSSTLRKRFK